MGNRQARNILYILPTKGWNTKERFAFRDIAQAKNHGYNVYLCTFEDSFAAKMAKKIDVEIIPYKSHFMNRFFSFHRHFPLSNVFKKMHVDIVHCYDFNLLCSLSIQLKRQNTTALVATMDHTIDKSLRRFWYKPIIARIDALIMANKNLLQDALGNLGLPMKKVEYMGLGIKYEEAANPLQIAVNFDLYKEYFLVGTYVSPERDVAPNLVPVLSALKVLNEKCPAGHKSKLVLISPVDFQNITNLQGIMHLIDEQDLKEDILFVTTQDIVGVISRLDLWVSTRAEDLIEDYAITALVHEVPVVIGRNFCSTDLIEEYEGVGETYKLFDARELRDKWEKVILGKAVYKEKTRLYKYFIEREHSYLSYKSHLMGLYSKLVQRRLRLFTKR